ncbi:MAG TPA: cytochrome c oxidase assembly protein [Chloroflexota bacterium]|jgi:cytochrome c oxidase assembly factor CtaG|nr:cytochrome c oxidase assembly protein [Chloroflexota bacterium]
MLASVLTHWRGDPTVLGAAVVAVAVYWLYTRGSRSAGFEPDPKNDRRFALMILLALFALESPLDYLGDTYLFSAHMLQHLLLMLGVAPLAVFTIPPALVRDLKLWLPGWFIRFLTNPIVAFAWATIAMWGWHAPQLFELALRDSNTHALEHLSFLESMFAFWWVAFAPSVSSRRLPAVGRIVYVFLGALPGTILGAALTFIQSPIYPTYVRALDTPGLGRTLALNFGLTPLVDQELGGLLMWVPGGFFYLVVIVGIFLSWAAGHQAAGGELPGVRRLEKPPRRVRSKSKA